MMIKYFKSFKELISDKNKEESQKENIESKDNSRYTLLEKKQENVVHTKQESENEKDKFELNDNSEKEYKEQQMYHFPPLNLLYKGKNNNSSEKELKETALRLQ